MTSSWNKKLRRRNHKRSRKQTDRVCVYLVRLWGGGGLWGRRRFRLPVGIVRGGLVTLIGWVRCSDDRPGCLDRGWRVGRSHSVSHSWSLLDAVTGCGGMGVGWGGLGTDETERAKSSAPSSFYKLKTFLLVSSNSSNNLGCLQSVQICSLKVACSGQDRCASTKPACQVVIERGSASL